MIERSESDLAGTNGRVVISTWLGEQPQYVVLLAHGYGEHMGRYDHVARRLVEAGAVVYGLDHMGHGKSDGERVVVEQVDELVADLRSVARQTQADYPDLPLAVVGHSMGGIIATRYAQSDGGDLGALVLSAPVIGGNPGFEALLAAGPALGSLPTLWIHGEDDALAPLELTREAIDRIRGERLEERVYEGARHELFNETNRDEVLSDVVSFLQRALVCARVSLALRRALRTAH